MMRDKVTKATARARWTARCLNRASDTCRVKPKLAALKKGKAAQKYRTSVPKERGRYMSARAATGINDKRHGPSCCDFLQGGPNRYPKMVETRPKPNQSKVLRYCTIMWALLWMT